MNADDPDVIEIWNLVFIQFNREPSGELRQLPNKHIDTGMGLERITSILQDKRSNYDTDVFSPLFHAIQQVIGCPEYSGKLGEADAAQNFKDMAYRVVADHIRTICFAIADGAVPSNEGRGYVLRRILRRAVRYGIQTLGAKPGFFTALVPHLVENMEGFYPELRKKQALIAEIIADEERAFTDLLDRGVKYFSEMVAEIEGAGTKVISGEKAFFLYDTLGFPVDLTQLMAAEKGLSVDLAGFQKALESQKSRSRDAAREKRLAGRTALVFGAEQTAYLQSTGVQPTDDSFKYSGEPAVSQATVKAIFTKDGFVSSLKDEDVFGLVLDATPFYAESGGQSADKGSIYINTANGQVALEVIDVQSYAGFILHTCVPYSDTADLRGITVSSSAEAKVDMTIRRRVAPNHTMTHVLNFALREILGSGVDQKGSSVNEDRLRFDFSINRGVQLEELVRIEGIVNDVIKKELPVDYEVVPLRDAMSVYGLRAVFGEVYPDPVRVVSVGKKVSELIASPSNEEWGLFSVEFCGGTHLSNTREAAGFVITEETAVAKGIRRITAITGQQAMDAIKNEEQVKSRITSLADKVAAASEDLEAIEGEVLHQRNAIESALISLVCRSNARTQLESMQKTIAAKKDAQLLAMVDSEIEKVKSAALELHESGSKSGIFRLAIGSDAKAIKRAIESIKKVAPSISFMGISTDSQKTTCFAVAEDPAIKANEWVSKAVGPFGGRGGGRENQAQGSVPDPSKADDVAREAAKYLASI